MSSIECYWISSYKINQGTYTISQIFRKGIIQIVQFYAMLNPFNLIHKQLSISQDGVLVDRF